MKTAQTPTTRVAYFSMEIGLENGVKEFAGGLGILAGDTLKAAADAGYNMMGISLLYKNGYFKQEFDAQGVQQEVPDTWDYEKFLTNTGKKVTIDMADGPVTAEIWQYTITGVNGHEVPVYFLNTDIPENQGEGKYISYNLYTKYEHTRIRQEIMLGIGGVYAMQELGHSVDVYHLNESHAAFGILGLEEILGSREDAKQKMVFTTHTPAEHGHVGYNRQRLQNYLAPRYLEMAQGDFEGDMLHLTKFCLRNSKYSNAVAKRHGEVSRRMFPDFEIDSITNGVHVNTWVAKATAEVFDEYIQDWRKDPSHLQEVIHIPGEIIWKMHQKNKQEMFDFICDRISCDKLNPDTFTIGFARRVDGYKRSGLIFHQLDVLKYLANKFGGLQIIMAGKAYFDYGPAEELIAKIRETASHDLGDLRIVYLEDYGMDISQMMVQGCDIWLNNPIKPLEASGTSGMKAALNGVPNFSTVDGWWVEGWEEGVTGWAIGVEDINHSEDQVDAYSIYSKLEHVILPMYYSENKESWQKIQKQAMSKNASYFTTARMVEEYMQKGYLK